MRKIKSVAFQGERGAFSEQAARKIFGRNLTTLPVPAFEDIFKLITQRKVDAGIVPIENSLQGSILEVYDLLEHFHLYIIGEVKLRVVHCLMAHRGASLKKIRRIYSHPQALAQCRSFLGRLPEVEAVPSYDTAGAAKLIREKNMMDAAAIASAEAARVYSLKMLARGIENNDANYTRFLVLGRAPVRVNRKGKTSLIFSVKNIPGSLVTALSPFASRRINLHKIESRPVIGKPWQYLFYLDFDGSVDEQTCADAIAELRKKASYVKVLGSYPRG